MNGTMSKARTPAPSLAATTAALTLAAALTATILFREASVWTGDRAETAATMLLCLLQLALIPALMVEYRRCARIAAKAQDDRHQMARIARVSLLGELSASIAHELNQPLTAILSNAQAAQRLLRVSPTPDLDLIRDIVDDIAADDRRAGLVIKRLQTVMTKSEPQHLPLHLEEVVEEALALGHGELVARDVSATKHFAETLPTVSADRIQMQQVVLNLILNAAQAQQELPRSERQIRFQAWRTADGGLQLDVIDRGHGIAPDQLTAIFEPLVTTKIDGIGMGLAICRAIVEDHGGRLWASNNAGPGATFHLTLPPLCPSLAADQADPPAPRRTSKPVSLPQARGDDFLHVPEIRSQLESPPGQHSRFVQLSGTHREMQIAGPRV